MTAVRKGIIAGDTQTVENQIQLLMQIALPDDPQLGADEEVEYMLVSRKAQEDHDFRQDLQAAPDLQPEPLSPAEPAPVVAAPAEVGTESHASAAVVETQSPGEEHAPVESGATAVAPEVKVLVEATKQIPINEYIVTMQAEGHPVFEVTAFSAQASPQVAICTDKTVTIEPAVLKVDEEEATAVVSEALAEVAAPVEAPTVTDEPLIASGAPHESLRESVTVAPSEASAPASETVILNPVEDAVPAPHEAEATAPFEETISASSKSLFPIVCFSSSIKFFIGVKFINSLLYACIIIVFVSFF